MNSLIDHIIENGIKSAVFWLIGGVVVAILLGVFTLGPGGGFPETDENAWQAVFLTNDQTYFGRLEDYDDTYVVLRNVYYLREALEPGAESANLDLIKLGGEVHGPEDEMFIAKSQILYVENLKETSRVVKAIQESGQ